MLQVIDSHVHVWDPSVLSYDWLNRAPSLNRPFLPRELPHAPGTQAVFVQADCRDDQALKEVDWVASLRATWPELAAIVAYAPINRGDGVSEDVLERLEERVAAVTGRGHESSVDVPEDQSH